MRRTLSFILCLLLSFPVFAQAYRIGSIDARQKPISGFQTEGMNGQRSQGTSTSEKKPLGGTGPQGFGEPAGGMGIQYQIHLLGQVEQAGTYRLSPSTRLDEAINKAGGIMERGSRRHVELRRDGKVFRYDLFKFQKMGDLSQNPFLLDNDVIFVPYAENNVAIRGPVKTSGVYELSDKDTSVWDLIQLAGGFTVGVFEKDPVTIVRFNDGKKELIKLANVQTELEQFKLLNGDIVVVPHLLGKNRRFDYDVVDLPADNLYVPTQKNEVFVTGAVSSGGAYPYNPSYTVRDFVNGAGPLLDLAKLQSVYVLTANGKYIRNPEKKKDFRLSPGDTVVVPKRSVTTDNVLKWYGTFTSTVFTSFAFKQLLFK